MLRFTRSMMMGWILSCVSGTPGWTAEEINYDEAKVPKYELPDPLRMADGTAVTTSEQWHASRRPELLALFASQMYGRTPEKKLPLRFHVFDQQRDALGGKAIRKQITVFFTAEEDGPSMDLLMYLPADRPAPHPIFVGLNFNGNHTIHSDPAIRLSPRWMRASRDQGVVDHRATEASRGKSASRWPLEQILARGYGVVTIYCGDLDPDFDDGFQNGIHPLFYEAGQSRPRPDQWGTIGAWAWGLSRAVDYLQTDAEIDAARIAVMGHSRLGKTSLWAGAQDSRFALVISNNSGCGGAALNRREFGETVRRINSSFPHWFCDNFTQYNDAVDRLPIDQHQLIALIAPRPVLVCSAEEDRWADPRGEFLAARHAGPVYRLLGTDGFAADEFPSPNQLIDSTVGYHLRPGKHDVTPADWEVYCDFADRHLTGK